MLKDVTLGQYFPGETSVHKLDPRTKLVLVNRPEQGYGIFMQTMLSQCDAYR